MIIYKITNKINSKAYIGQTIQKLENRWKRHINSKNNGSAIRFAIQKYGKENFEIKVLTRCNSLEEMNHRETYYIKLFDTFGPNGYNLTSGDTNKKLAQETKDKISVAHLGKKLSKDHKKKIGKGITGRKVSQATKAKIAIGNTGNIKSVETREKISFSKKLYYKNNPESAKNHSLKLKKRFKDNPELSKKSSISRGGIPFSAFNACTLELVWTGINKYECARTLGVNRTNIIACLKSRQKTCHNYIFRYVGQENFEQMKKRKIQNVINVETGQIFESIGKAGLFYKIHSPNIKRAALNGLTAGGFHWKYV